MASLPLKSREYKLILKSGRFEDREAASGEFLEVIAGLADQATVTSLQDRTDRYTSFLDASGSIPRFGLKDVGFSLRIREEGKKIEVNLKSRGTDREKVSASDVSSLLDGKQKFEADIVPPLTNKFSKSNTVKLKEIPDLDTIGKIMAVFPGLPDLGMDDSTPVTTVRNFRPFEIDKDLCSIQFGADIPIVASLNFWYTNDGGTGVPIITEFSFKVNAQATPNPGDIETFPNAPTEGANLLFDALQHETGWFDPGSKTKTDFVYGL